MTRSHAAPPCNALRLIALFLTLGATVLAPPARGQNPPTPVHALFPGGYFRHSELTTALETLQAEHPDRVRLTSLGRSLQGRDIWLLTIGKHDERAATPGSTPGPRPAVLVVANLEADHVIGSQVALGLAERLAKATGRDAAWLERCTVHIVPRLNPDGAERALEKPGVEARGNLRPFDRDRDGRLSEDGPDDLDGDGLAVRMRVKDPATATLVPDSKDPRILRPANAAKGEQPVYAEESEGRDDDGDGLRNEDPPVGVNLNRNWPHRWTEFDPETGFSPASEPEVHALIAWAFAHPEVAVVWSFGLDDNLREEPKKPAADLDDADLPLLVELSQAYQRRAAPRAVASGGSPAGKGSVAPGATTDGSIAGWAYRQFGAVGLASRLWTTPEIPPPATTARPSGAESTKKAADTAKAGSKPSEGAAAEKSAIPEEGEARWLYWNDHVVDGRAFVPFHAFRHPTLGAVEIGGWRPGVRINPPSTEFEAITATHHGVLLDLLDRLPKLSTPEVKVESKGGGLYAVTAVVRNDGYFPTALAQGVRNRKAPPVLVRLDPGGATVVAGQPRERVDTLAGSGGRKEFRWLLMLAPDAQRRNARIEVVCPRAGRVTAPIELP